MVSWSCNYIGIHMWLECHAMYFALLTQNKWFSSFLSFLVPNFLPRNSSAEKNTTVVLRTLVNGLSPLKDMPISPPPSTQIIRHSKGLTDLQSLFNLMMRYLDLADKTLKAFQPLSVFWFTADVFVHHFERILVCWCLFLRRLRNRLQHTSSLSKKSFQNLKLKSQIFQNVNSVVPSPFVKKS